MKPNRKVVIGSAILASLLVVIVLLMVFSSGPRSAASDEDKGALVPPELLKDSRPGSGAASGTAVDLLDLIRISKDAVAGSWGFQDRALITSGIPWGRLQIPCVPPKEYDLKLQVTRKRGVNSLNLGVVLDGAQGMIVLDGWDGRTSCLLLGDGVDPSTNETTRSDIKVMKWNKPTSIVVAVRKEGITVSSEGKTILDWKGRSSDFHVPPGFLVPNSKALYIGSFDSIFRIDEMTLVPVSGEVQLLRTEPVSPPASAPR